jgi:2-alkenal reductase
MIRPFHRFIGLAALLLLAAIAAQPYVDRLLLEAREPRAVTPRGDLSETELSAIAVFEAVAPSVVQVIGTPTDIANPSTGLQSGSGFVWDRAGHVVTNNHVVADAHLIRVRLATGDVVAADVIGLAPNYDLAVLKLNASGSIPPPVMVGSSAELQVGQSAFAIGNPFGLDQSLTTGIISALERRLPTSGGREVTHVIQTDAAINPGNSGGPLLDSAGRLIGVNTAIFSPSGTNAGVGFAIPVDVVNRVIPELISEGRVPTPGIGILAADEALTARLGVEGILVANVLPGSPAERAGIVGLNLRTGQVGDIITAVNGEKVGSLPDLIHELESAGIGNQVRITLRRPTGSMSVDLPVVDIGRS